MAWNLEGTTNYKASGSSGSTAEDFTLPGTPAEGDLVIVTIVADSTMIYPAGNVNSSGWTLAFIPDSSSPSSQVWWKEMGATPDTVINIQQEGSSILNGCIQTWSGGSSGDMLDAAAVSASGSSEDGGSDPDPAQITTDSDNALVFAIAFLDDDNSSVNTWPTGYTNGESSDAGTAEANHSSSFVSSKIVTSAGAENPNVYELADDDGWHCCTISFTEGAGGGGSRTTKNTRAFPLGVEAGMGFSMGKAA